MKHLHPKAYWLIFTRYYLGWMAFLLIIGTAGFGLIPVFIVAVHGPDQIENMLANLYVVYLSGYFFANIVVALPLLLWSKTAHEQYQYELTEKGLRKDSGVFIKKHTSIYYSHIQNVDIKRGILTRLLGLSVIMIQTAGASSNRKKAEGELLGLSVQDAEILREELIKRAHTTQEPGGV